ncbi:MAG: ABC transporter ATP-binding protein [Thermoguttaceae bacterium]|nr:ABC transporter ATP-binding protein [Thermoguttaceae bacterium]
MKKNSCVIEFENVTRRFGKIEAVGDLSLRVAKGRIFALLGKNGAGKTTLIKMMLGQLRPDSGTVRVLGLDPCRHNLEIRRKIGYVPERPRLYEWMSAEEIGRFAGAFYTPRYLEEFLRLLDQFRIDPSAKIKNLSKGLAAQVSLALALAGKPEILILDEPTGGLDTLVRRSFTESIIEWAAGGKTIFLSSHQVSEVERFADDIGLIKKGVLVRQEPLESIKERTKRIVLTFDKILPEDDSVERALRKFFTEPICVTRSGRMIEIVGLGTFDNLPKPGTEIAEARLCSCDCVSMTLEDIFIASVQ